MDQDPEAREVVLELLSASLSGGDAESRKMHMDLAAMPMAAADPSNAMTRIATASLAMLHEMVPFLARAYGLSVDEFLANLRD